MRKNRIKLANSKQRSILTDMLPFEVPPTFSNSGFYNFLQRNDIRIESDKVLWTANTQALDLAIRVLFGVKSNTPIDSEIITEWGKTKTRRSIPLKSCKMDTIPFNFRIAHNLDGRVLSVAHPRNQIAVADFYATYSSLIIYHTSISEVSIRHPVSVARYSYFKDKLHKEKIDEARGIEEEEREYEQLGSYFVYRKYRNIHKFFESYKYHNSEKKYNAMVQIDVSKCFDSIYSHSITWAILGKHQTKFKLKESKFTFGGRFDVLMQNLNHNETNGIIIGPEFSRIFAEVILQSVDIDVLKHLAADNLHHKVHFEMFRYVDDFFVFYNEESTQLKILETLQNALKSKKLSINAAKIKHYEKPIITEITIAKERISTLIEAEINPTCELEVAIAPNLTESKRFSCFVNSNRLIIRYKAAIKESSVSYGDLLNYTLAIVEKKIGNIFTCYKKCDRELKDQKKLIGALLAIMEFNFFVYSASPKVNHTIRLSRMVASVVNFMHNARIPYEIKHQVFKYIHSNIMQQLEKNVMNPHREVESLYLLASLSHLGREYWLPEAILVRHFLIAENEHTKEYERSESLAFFSHFSTTVLLSYIKNKVRYKKLKNFLEKDVVAKLSFTKAHCPNDTEALLLLLDLAVCPYVTRSTKNTIAQAFGLSPAELIALQSVNDYWFTAWGDKFDLAKALDAKRSREVY